jgi:hypothetical protein
VSPGRFGDAFTAAIYEDLAKKVRQKLASVRCPDHHQAPNVEITGSAKGNLGWKVSGCCQKLIDRATDALK